MQTSDAMGSLLVLELQARHGEMRDPLHVIPGRQRVQPLDSEPMLVANSITSPGEGERQPVSHLFFSHIRPMDGTTWPLALCLHSHFKYKGSPFSEQKFGCTLDLSYGIAFIPSNSYPMLHLLKKRLQLSSYICFPLGSTLNLPAAVFDFSVV